MKTKKVVKAKKVKRVKTEVSDKIKRTVHEVNEGFPGGLEKATRKLHQVWEPLIEKLDSTLKLMSNEGLVETKTYNDLVEINNLIREELAAFSYEGKIDLITEKLREINNYLIQSKKIN